MFFVLHTCFDVHWLVCFPVRAQVSMTEAAYGLPTDLPVYLLPASRPFLRGTPLTARIDECRITPLEAPGAPKLIFVRGALRGREEGSVPFRLHLQQVTVQFHSEQWRIFTYTSSSSNSFAVDLDATSLTYSGDFTDIRHLRRSTWAICSAMRRFYLTVRDREGQFSHNVLPFDPTRYSITVHPAAVLLFANTREHMLALQAICTHARLFDLSPRYWLGNDGNMVLEEWGRWRSQFSLEWLATYGFRFVPQDMLEELVRLCSERDIFANARLPGYPSSYPPCVTSRLSHLCVAPERLEYC